MKYLKPYKLFESRIEDLASCLYDLTDIGFEPEEDGLDQTKEVKRISKITGEGSEDNLILALKLIKRVKGDKLSGYFEGTFDKNNFNQPTEIDDPEYLSKNKKDRDKFTKFEKDLLVIIEDSVGKIMSLYLKKATHGTYVVNQSEVVYGTCVVVLLQFYK